MIRLTIEASDAGPRHVSLDVLPIVIGRDPGSDLVIDDPLASRRHAQIERDDAGQLRVRDLGSSNGTFADGSRLTGPVAFSPRVAIRIGRTFIRLEGSEPAQAETLVAIPGAVASAAVPPPGERVAAPMAAPTPGVPGPPGADGPPRSRRSNLIGLGVLVAAFALVGIIGAIALTGGGPGQSSASTAPAVARSSTSASPSAIVSAVVSPIADGSPSPADSPGGTELNFAITIGSTSFTSKSTITPTICKRGASGPHSLMIDYTSPADSSSRLMLAIDDTMASPPVASVAEISLGFAGLSRPLVATGSEVRIPAITDAGDHAVLTTEVKNSKGDKLSGTITCSSIGS